MSLRNIILLGYVSGIFSFYAVFLVLFSLFWPPGSSDYRIAVPAAILAVCLLFLALGLRRRYRIVWWLSVFFSGVGTLLFGLQVYIAATTLPDLMQEHPEVSASGLILILAVSMLSSVSSLALLLLSTRTSKVISQI